MRVDLQITCGLPASGKSTFSGKMARDCIVVLCPDNFRKIITGKEFHGPAEEMVWSHVKIAARALLQYGYSVLIDATATTPSLRSQWINLAKDLDPEARIDCHVMLTPYSICLKRNKMRDRFVPEFIMEKQRDMFVLPTVDEGFGYICYYDSSGEEIGTTSIDPDDGSTWLDGRAEELIALGNPYTVREFLGY